MKITILAIVGVLFTSTFAQTFNGVPACAQPCVANYLSGSTIAGCNSVDIACICSNASFLSGIACCLVAACSAADQAAAVKFATDLCQTNGVTNLPTAVSCASTVSSTGSATSATSATRAPAANTVTSSSTAATTTAKTGAGPAQNAVGMGAGFAGGLAAAVVALL